MKTELITSDIVRAAEIIRNGGLVAVPTETVYGLAGNGLDEAAVRDIYEVKGRPEVKPLSLMVPGSEAMEAYCCDVPKTAYALAEKFWPGPLTIILKSKACVPEIVRAGGATVGLRCPDHEMTLSLLRECGLPLAAPSANPSGEASPKTAGKVMEYFDGEINAVLDGGECGIGTESTIIDMSAVPYRILRKGALGEKEIFSALTDSLTLVGITGGTGCGKTTALNVLESMGALIVDADEVYHFLCAESAEMREELTERFGDVYTDGKLDRKALGAIVFSDPEALKDLNRITHKYVSDEIQRRLELHALGGGKLAAIDAIALLEGRFAKRTAFNVAITAPTEARVQRLLMREGISEEYARSRIAAQRPNEYFEENCDYTLCNDGSRAEFENVCNIFFMEVLKGVQRT